MHTHAPGAHPTYTLKRVTYPTGRERADDTTGRNRTYLRRQRRGPVQGHRHRAAIAKKVSDAVASLGLLRKLAAGNW
jgi:hypothetical protein